MHSSLKLTAALLVNLSLLAHQVLAQLPPINFETYESVPLDLSSPDPWEPIYGNSAVTPAGQGFGGGKALKIGVDPAQEAWLRKPVAWNAAESVAFIDFRIKPAATPEGSEANFFANGTQIAFQLPGGSTTGQLWVLHGNDDALPVPPATTVPEEKWYLTAGTYPVPTGATASTTWVRATLRHDYQRNIWDLFIDGKLAAVNLGFEGRGANLDYLEFFGSKAGDTLIDNLEANPSNMLFPDADKDGLPDAWEIANGSNPNLYDRDAIDPVTGKSFLNKYLDSLWNSQSPGTPVNGSAGLGNVGTVPPLTILNSHQPVGALKGQFAVGGDGAATYTIPLDIPKGRAGMEPKLSLNYSSNAGNGPLGVGWSIGGLQKITRGPSSLKKDGIADGADFDANDRYFLDGERLVCIAGTYGADGSEYRTEMDSYARIKAVGQMVEDPPDGPPVNLGPASWTVETKSGLKITLGNSASSKVQVDSFRISDDPLQPTYTVTPNTWLEFKYRTLPDSGALSGKPKWGMIGLDEDALTANPKRVFKIVGGTLPPIPTYNSSSWEYTRSDGEPDTIRIHVGQHFTGQMRHLVLVSDDNTVNNGVGESWFRNVRLFEGNPTAGGVMTKSFHFDQAIAAPQILDGNNEDLGVRIQDMDGDGLPDIAYNLLYGKTSGTGAVTLQTFGQALRNTGSEFVNDAKLKLPPSIPTGNLPGAGEGQFANSQAIYPVPVDINADGQLDYAYAKNLTRESNGTFTCEHGYLTRVNNAWVELTAYAHHFKSNCATSQKRFSHFEHIDLDSDGDLDLLVHPYGATLTLLPGKLNTTPLASFPIVGNSGSNVGVAYLNKFHEGDGWVGTSDWRLPVPLRIPGFNSNGGEVGRSIQDLNGDGRPDLYSALWQANKNVWLNKETANGWDAKDSGSIYQVPENLTNSSGDDVGTRLVDVNGDGKVDVIKALGSGSLNLQVGVSLNTGNGWVSDGTAALWLPEENFNTIDKRKEVQEQGTSFVDLNADGLVDFVVSKPTINTTASTNGIRHAMLVDLNGDGVSDLIGDMKSPVPKIWINQAKPERIVSFTDGYAASIQVDTYARLNDPTPVPNSLGLNRRVYDKTPVSDGDSNTTWDSFLPAHVSLCDNRWVVARYSEPDGKGGRRYRAQYYRDLRHDKANEASLGFGQIEVHDEVTRGYTVTQTRRDYPLAGSVHLTRSYAFVGGSTSEEEPNPLPSQPGIPANSFHLVSEESASYDQLASTTGIGSIGGAQHFVYRPVQTVSVAKKFELGDPVNPVSRVTTTQNVGDFDGFGFVRKSTVTALDESSTSTENAYWHDTAGKWLLGRLAASRVKKTYGGASTTKTSGFAYRSSDGLLVKEVVEPQGIPADITTWSPPSNFDPLAKEPAPVTSGSGGHPGGVEKSYVLDSFGNTTTESVKAYTARGTTTQTRRKFTEWGHNGRFPVREDTDGLGGTQDAVHTYNAERALITSSKDIDDRVTDFEYDSFGTQIATHLPDGTSTAEITRFVANGHLPPAVINATAGATLRWARRAQASGTPWATVYFDTLGREIVTEKLVLVSLSNGTPRFGNQYVVNCFDAKGRNYRTSNPFFAGDQVHWSIFHHDALDRVYKTTRPDTTTEGIQSIAVESPGTLNPLSKVVTYDAKGNQLQRWTDQHGRMVKSSDASGQSTTFSHDPDGRVKSVSIGSVEQLANHFDIVGNKWKVVDLSGGTSTSVTNGFGEVISTTTPHGTIGTLYDSLGRVSVVTKLEGIYTTTYNQSSPALGAPDRIDGSGAAAGYMEDFFYGGSVPYEYGKVIEVRKRQSSSEPTYFSRTAYNALGLVMDEMFDGEFNSNTSTDATPDDDAHVSHEYDPVFGSFELRTKLIRGAHHTLLSETGSLNISGHEATATGMLAHGILRKVTTDIRNGRILRIESDQGSTELQHLTYDWDSVGNLLSRQDRKANANGTNEDGMTEVFEYDTLNRLKKSTIDSQTPVLYEYETNGNLKSKAGSPNRIYAGYRVETAVVKGQPRFHTYDAAGYIDEVREINATGPLIREHDWTSFGQLKQVSHTSTPKLETFAATQTYAANGIPGLALAEVYLPSQAVAQFDFDASGGRSKQTLTRNFGLGSEKRCVTRYLGTYESEVHETKPGNGSYALDKILHRHRLGGALLTTEVPYSGGVAGSPVTRLAVVLTDHIGSTDVIVRGDWTGNGWNLSANQQKAERQSFDAWGGRRDQSTWTDLHPVHNSTRKTSGFDQDRGFTGHEMLDDFGLVHMNGRIYDSDLGRFLSPDPYVQVPEYSQNFNRYSYVLNNPLSYTDPTGYEIDGIWVAVIAIVVAVVTSGVGSAFITAGEAAFATSGAAYGASLTAFTAVTANAAGTTFVGLSWAGMATAGAIGGAVGGALNAAAGGGDGGDILRGALVGAVQGGISAGVLHGLADGLNFDNAYLHVAGHGIVGGAANEAMGGKFQDGFLAAAASAAAGHIPGMDSLMGSAGDGSPVGIAARTIVSGVIGGTASALGGGKFANGAYTAAFQHLLNAELHWHHLFPVFRGNAADWTQWFLDQGIDPNAMDNGLMVDSVKNIGKGGLHPSWNNDWKAFRAANPKATASEMINFKDSLLKKNAKLLKGAKPATRGYFEHLAYNRNLVRFRNLGIGIGAAMFAKDLNDATNNLQLYWDAKAQGKYFLARQYAIDTAASFPIVLAEGTSSKTIVLEKLNGLLE